MTIVVSHTVSVNITWYYRAATLQGDVVFLCHVHRLRVFFVSKFFAVLVTRVDLSAVVPTSFERADV